MSQDTSCGAASCATIYSSDEQDRREWMVAACSGTVGEGDEFRSREQSLR